MDRSIAMTHRPGMRRPRTRAPRLAAVAMLAMASTLAGPDESAATVCIDWGEPPLVALLSPVDRPLPMESALVVEYRAADPLPAFELRRGRRRIPMTAETLAPGLFRLRPSRPPSPGSWQLHVRARKRIQVPVVPGKGISAEQKPLPLRLELTRAPVPAVAAAPSLEKAVLEPLPWETYRIRVYAFLSAPVPPDAVAVIGMWSSRGPGEPPAPATARAPIHDGTQVLVHDSREHACAPPPPGFVHPHGGALARFALVDRFGRVIPLAGERPLEPVEISPAGGATREPARHGPPPSSQPGPAGGSGAPRSASPAESQ